jgi:hypothetical protein
MSTSHRVTVKHIRYLASGPKRHNGQVAGALVDTDDGIRLIIPDEVFGDGVRRLLMSLADLADDADAAGMTPPAYAREHGGRIAAELNGED